MSNELKKRILSSIILFPLSLFFIFKGSFYLIIFTIFFFIISLFEWNKMINKFSLRFLGSLFLFFSFYTFYQISSTSKNILIFIFLVCVITDIGGYIFGKLFKGPKLINISPNKTYSGMIGGYFSSIILIIIYLSWSNQVIKTEILIIALFISTLSQIGDIIISYFKRLSKVKDTGKIIPGHGGLLDRIDGMIFAYPFFYLFNLTGLIS